MAIGDRCVRRPAEGSADYEGRAQVDSYRKEVLWAVEYQEATISDDHAAHLYDAVSQWGADDAFFLNVATSGHSTRVLDLGCGTGRITIEIVQADVAGTGIDPHQPSVAAAQQKPNADRVEWVIGDSRTIPAGREFGVAIMSSNVAQAILEDADLSRTFRDIAAHMPSGGRLAFDSRDPRARGWERWTKDRSLKTIELPEGPSHHWYQTTHVDESTGLVDFCAHEVDAEGRERKACDRIRFRSEEHLRSLLTDAGFIVDAVFGGFEGEPVAQGIGALVFIAHRA
ncbi:class I SAM-dependent methyltransferase [Arthrobacter sp.]|uniref:class I SAM-dependent methyltransferase n=1 Tax=Arthrobacter sp. TaxID=1667 RepID=UPI003A8D8503